eukprot:XP_001708323.1 Hypothetical protein GL50803_1882 [Giardia lamblia ATCC 50803]
MVSKEAYLHRPKLVRLPAAAAGSYACAQEEHKYIICGDKRRDNEGGV